MGKTKSPLLKSKPPKQSLATGFSYMNSPIGRLSILADEQGILEIRFPNNSEALPPAISESNEIVEQAIDQLHAYFDGRRKISICP